MVERTGSLGGYGMRIISDRGTLTKADVV